MRRRRDATLPAGSPSISVMTSTALSPALFGWLLDGGLDVDQLILGGVALAVFVSLLGLIAPAPARRPRGSASTAETRER